MAQSASIGQTLVVDPDPLIEVDKDSGCLSKGESAYSKDAIRRVQRDY